jgi:hypothetical protein
MISPTPPPYLVDIRHLSSKQHVIRARPWSKVTGICLHQTACVLGERPARWQNCGAHLGITRAGQVIWIHDFTQAVVHGHGWNAQTVGIEIDGCYAGIEGDPRTFWKPRGSNRQPQSPTPEAIEAAKATIRWITAVVAQNGGAVTALVAHRQASKSRQSDPGSAIWQAVALPLHQELGLHDGGPGFTLGDGLPIPEAWDPTRKGIRY